MGDFFIWGISFYRGKKKVTSDIMKKANNE